MLVIGLVKRYDVVSVSAQTSQEPLRP